VARSAWCGGLRWPVRMQAPRAIDTIPGVTYNANKQSLAACRHMLPHRSCLARCMHWWMSGQ
jgi:hypothetical protein